MMGSRSNAVESQLLLAAARHQPGADWFDQHKPEAIDWRVALEMASDHGVLPMVVKMLAPQSQSIGKIAIVASQQVRLNHLRNMQLLAELRRLSQLLSIAGIRMLPYKGPTLAMVAYGDLAMRQAGDLDLLVDPVDAQRAEEILTADGYTLDAPQADANDATAHDYHRGFSHAARRITIELHWRLVGESFSFEPTFDDLWQRGADLAVGDSLLRVMSAEDTFIVLAAHGMKHFWSRLGWICDVAELVRTHPAICWEEVFARAKSLGGERIVRLAAQLAHDICFTQIPPQSLAATPRAIRKCSRQVAEHLFAVRDDSQAVTRGMRMELAGGGWVASLLFHLRMRERWTDGWKYIAHRVFTPTAIEREWVTLPKPLRAFYYLVRPIRLTAERFSARGRSTLSSV